MENKEFILDQTTIKKLLTTYKLRIPDFQRSFVWKKNKKVQLLDSLFRGFPIGALTLYEDEGGYYIIDGLQRINTLKQYLSSPSDIVSFTTFWPKVEKEISDFLDKNTINIEKKKISRCVKVWYESLEGLYEYEKVSVLYGILMKQKVKLEEINDLQFVEELRDILKSKIEILHDDIALIIYKGDKEDLPELFKNINTGSVALSQYEILQSLWIDNYLNKEIVEEEYRAFIRELELIRNDYEIDGLKEEGKFDIFKNIIGLNNRICCIENSGLFFDFNAYKKITPPKELGDTKTKFYDNDTIGFEIYSTILCYASNKIIKAIDLIYLHRSEENKIDYFVKELNELILQMLNEAIDIIQREKLKMIESKYHSLYILVGLVLANYDIDVDKLEIKRINTVDILKEMCFNIERHRTESWFVDENRQMGFFVKNIPELVQIKKSCISE